MNILCFRQFWWPPPPCLLVQLHKLLITMASRWHITELDYGMHTMRFDVLLRSLKVRHFIKSLYFIPRKLKDMTHRLSCPCRCATAKCNVNNNYYPATISHSSACLSHTPTGDFADLSIYGLSQASILEKLGTALFPLSTTGSPSPCSK